MKPKRKPPSQTPRAKKYQAKMAAKGRSGRQGVKNAWNVFWKEQQHGLQGLPTKRRRQELTRSYHALPPDELQRLTREARAWTQRARGLLDPAAAEIVARQNLAAKGILAGPNQAAEVVLPADIARRQEDRPISQTIQQMQLAASEISKREKLSATAKNQQLVEESLVATEAFKRKSAFMQKNP
jgi:hypothetical protein